MPSVADFQARARARALQVTSNIPETITAEGAPRSPENDGNDGTNDEATESGASAPQPEDPIPHESTDSNNTFRRDGITVNDVTHLVQHRNLPEGIVSDVRNFQRVRS